MANDGTVKIGAEIDEKEFQESLSKLSKTANSALGSLKFDVETDEAQAGLKDLQKEAASASESLKKGTKAADDLGQS